MSTVISQIHTRPVRYSESDGKPMAESDIHLDQMIGLRETLDDYFREEPFVYVSGNLFIYYEEGDPTKSLAPDLFVVRGVPKRKRRVYKVWEEGKRPDLVVEVTSKGTRRQDWGKKWRIYATVLGVQEYVLFDPLGEYVWPMLQGYHLVGGEYERLPYAGESEKVWRVWSEVLGLMFHAEGERLRLYDPQTEEWLLSPREAQAARRAAEARVVQEAESRRVAEEEVARLRAELERLQSG